MSTHRKTNLKGRITHVYLTGAFKGAARGAGGEAEGLAKCDGLRALLSEMGS